MVQELSLISLLIILAGYHAYHMRGGDRALTFDTDTTMGSEYSPTMLQAVHTKKTLYRRSCSSVGPEETAILRLRSVCELVSPHWLTPKIIKSNSHRYHGE